VSNPRTVTVCQVRLTHYRVPLFDALRVMLKDAGVRMILVHGQPAAAEVSKQDTGDLPWATVAVNKYFRAASRDLVWQPLPPSASATNLVVVTQENRILSNYALQLRRKLGGPKVAFWGHGANFQSDDHVGRRERWKRYWLTHVDWWFAYTAASVERVAGAGFPISRITNLENTIDATALQTEIAEVEGGDLADLRRRLGWEHGRIALFLGSLYKEKRLDFLFDAADHLHDADPSFRLLIVGDGPLRRYVEDACVKRRWCAWMGAKTGREKATYLAVAAVMLNPGAVGLAVLDSFAAETPIVTTACNLHGPEIAYIRQGENGLITENTLGGFVAGVREVLNDDAYRARLVAGCRLAATHYTIENMARNFSDGILGALAL